MGDELAKLQEAVRSLRHGDRVCNLDMQERRLVRFQPRLKARRVQLAPAPVALAPRRLDVGDERAGLPAARLVQAGAGARRVVGLVVVDVVRLARVEPRLGLGVQGPVVGFICHLVLKHALLNHGKHVLAVVDVGAVENRLPRVAVLPIASPRLLDRLANVDVLARARARVQVHAARQRLAPRLPEVATIVTRAVATRTVATGVHRGKVCIERGLHWVHRSTTASARGERRPPKRSGQAWKKKSESFSLPRRAPYGPGTRAPSPRPRPGARSRAAGRPSASARRPET